MAKIIPSTYVKPVPAEKDNPFVELVKPFAAQGIDTPFDVVFDPKEYAAEKLLIQKAANVHGVSAREVEKPTEEQLAGKADVKSTFLIRPQRKPRKGETPAETEAAEGAADAE